MSHLFIGLMCGTSADGIDAALVEWKADNDYRLIATHEHTLPRGLRQDLLSLNNHSYVSLKKLSELDNFIATTHAKAVEQLLSQAQITAEQIHAIGFHGQTIDHSPATPIGNTTQWGNAHLLATTTGISVVADLRRADMAVGGQGAPLAPAMHAKLLRSSTDTAVVNIGGIANLSLLPADESQPVIGFDTGPGNCLMDEWTHTHIQADFDRDGQFAQSGVVQPALLAQLLLCHYFDQNPPKSTGRDLFNLQWLKQQLENQHYAPEDVQATLLALTSQSIVHALQATLPNAQHLYVCGGGARNKALMQSLQVQLPKVKVSTTAVRGIDPDWVEAILMSWLARQYCHNLPGNLPSVTGAIQPVRLGVRFDPPQNKA